MSGSAGADRSSKVQWARKSIAVRCAKVPVVVETTWAREKLVSKEPRRQRRCGSLSVDTLLWRWLGKGVGRSSRAGREESRG
jgi:hypothetical protein